MIAECARCGAPLDIRLGASLTKCSYCGQTNRTDTMRTVLPQTPRDWRPPPTWTPPQQFPAPSDVMLRYQASAGGAAVVVWLVAIVMLVGGASFAALFVRKGAGSFGAPKSGAYVDPKAVTPDQLAKLSMRASLPAIAGKLGLSSNDAKRLRVPLKGSPWDAVLFEWEDADPAHVAEFTLTAPAKVSDAKAIRAALAAALPPRWDKDEQYFRWEGVTVYVPNDGKLISVHVTTDEERGAGWRTQTEVLWAIVGNAALGFEAKVDEDAVRDFLGGGKPITALATLDSEVDVDGAQKAVEALFPGATVRKAGGLQLTVPLAHPVWREVELSWPNAKSGKLERMYFRPAAQKVTGQASLAKCLEKGLGTTARTMESDHLAKKMDYLFNLPNGGELRLYDHMLMLTVHAWWGAPIPKGSWPKDLKVIDDCGRDAPPSATNR